MSRPMSHPAAGSVTGSGPVSVRPMRPADLTVVAELDATAFPFTAWSRESFAAELGQVPAARWYAVAHPSGEPTRVLGFVGLMAPLSGGGPADVTTLAVSREELRRGIGSTLLGAALTQAAERGADAVVLEVAETNVPALALYARHGFEAISRRSRYYAGPQGPDSVDAVVLSRVLGDPGLRDRSAGGPR